MSCLALVGVNKKSFFLSFGVLGGNSFIVEIDLEFVLKIDTDAVVVEDDIRVCDGMFYLYYSITS